MSLSFCGAFIGLFSIHFQTPGPGDRERGPSSRAQLDDLVSSLLSASPAGVVSPRDGRASHSGLDRSISGRTSRLSESTATNSDKDKERDRERLALGISTTAGTEADVSSPQITTGSGSAGSVSGEVAETSTTST